MLLPFTRFVWVLTLVTAATSSSLRSSKRSGDSVIDCLNSHKVPYADSSSPNWTQLITPYNLRLPYTPAVVTLPTTSQEVGDGVACAAATSLKVQAKGGGHSYASFSSGGRNGSVIIDVESFNTIEVDQSEVSKV
jgi:hypothetical protein